MVEKHMTLRVQAERGGYRAEVTWKSQTTYTGVGTGLSEQDAVTCAMANLVRIIYNGVGCR